MHRSTIVALAICCAAALGLAACSSSSSKGSSSTSNAAITIKDLKFTVSSVKAGSEVSVKNSDGFGHTITADNGEFNVSVDGNGHATFKAPTKPGTYKFHCNI